jgi:hypothetical protein
MLEPLLQLRADWRRAAIDTVPSLAPQVVELLDRAIDYLESSQHVDREGLVTAVELVTDSLPNRVEEREILRSRLISAVQDYFATESTSRPTRIDPSKTVFGTEEALVEALYQIASGGTVENVPETPGEQKRSVPSTLSRKDLERALNDYYGRRRRFRTKAIRVVVLVGIVAAGAVFLVTNWSEIYSSNSSPQPSPASGRPLFTYRGTLDGANTVCNQGASQKPNECNVAVALTGGKARLDIKVTSTANQTLTTTVLDHSGNVVSSQTSSGGQADVITGVVEGGQTYTFLWTSSPSAPLNFFASVYSTT